MINDDDDDDDDGDDYDDSYLWNRRSDLTFWKGKIYQNLISETFDPILSKNMSLGQ